MARLSLLTTEFSSPDTLKVERRRSFGNLLAASEAIVVAKSGRDLVGYQLSGLQEMWRCPVEGVRLAFTQPDGSILVETAGSYLIASPSGVKGIAVSTLQFPSLAHGILSGVTGGGLHIGAFDLHGMHLWRRDFAYHVVHHSAIASASELAVVLADGLQILSATDGRTQFAWKSEQAVRFGGVLDGRVWVLVERGNFRLHLIDVVERSHRSLEIRDVDQSVDVWPRKTISLDLFRQQWLLAESGALRRINPWSAFQHVYGFPNLAACFVDGRMRIVLADMNRRVEKRLDLIGFNSSDLMTGVVAVPGSVLVHTGETVWRLFDAAG